MKEDRFFSKLDWFAFWTATFVTFIVYFLTLGPSVGLEDSGELATAAANLGVPHPPGYPFWTFCSWLFCQAFSWVTYMGYPTPAWCVALCSAVFGAFAAGCTAMLICRSAHDFISGDDSTSTDSQCSTANALLCFGGAVGGALTFAFSPVEWSQSTIVEIYSLNALFLMWVFLLSYRWMKRPSDKILWITAFIFGLGLTNYQVLLFAIVPLALLILLKNIGMFRDVFIYLIPVGLTWQLLQIGQLFRADVHMSSDAINKHLPLINAAIHTPPTWLLVTGIALVILSILLAIRTKKPKIVLSVGGSGVAVLILSSTILTTTHTWAVSSADLAPLVEPTRYAFIAAMIAASVVCATLAALREEKWTKELFLSMLCAFIAIASASLVPEAGDGGYRGVEFPWLKSTGMFILLLVVLFALTAFTKKGLAFAIPVAGFHIAAFILLKHGAMNGLTHPTSWWFGWTIAWNFIVLALVWLTLPNGRSVAGAAFFAQLGVSFYVYMPIVSELRNPPMNWGYPRTWEGFKHAIMRGQYEAIDFRVPTWAGISGYFKDVMVQFTDILAILALVPFAAGHWIVRKENRKAFWQWMIPAVVCFLLMSVLLIGLANVKGDVQDGFIQKVKFISSHAMIALWIGYGLVFAGVVALRVLGRMVWFGKPGRLGRTIYSLAALMILVAGVTPILQNYLDERLVFELGGAEQNGHTFGWQFGAYQLEGANAIREQLVADEEPLPDPDYPPPMDKFSIFFGGTDPGRFVPTYMIYSANFRPDIYLITQNALADDTYMSVERDLYGDEIWIPSKDDSAEAFNRYVSEAQADPVRYQQLLENGTLRLENGRVQVTGALAVMDINGILTKMMHEHDRYRHSFYVEESYQIQWMYPYLSPHGLIMKINAEKTPYETKRAQQDQDFWDWYMRRLIDDPMYGRDFAGQKSFSKLRAALAGLYQKQGRYREAAQAYREAMILYPASPEATFRYAQESLLPFRKYDIALELMDYTDHIDPNNRRTESLRDYVTRIRELTATLERLEAKRRDPKATLTAEETFALATCYYEMGRTLEAAQFIRTILDRLAEADTLRVAAKILKDARMEGDAEKAMTKYLKLRPTDAHAWADLAKIQARQKKRAAAEQSFIQAYRLDAKAIYERLRREEELYNIAKPLFDKGR